MCQEETSEGLEGIFPDGFFKLIHRSTDLSLDLAIDRSLDPVVHQSWSIDPFQMWRHVTWFRELEEKQTKDGVRPVVRFYTESEPFHSDNLTSLPS